MLLHEPLLAQVLAGVLPSFSGVLRCGACRGPSRRSGSRPSSRVRARRGAVGVVVHGGTAWSSLAALRASGADAFALAVAGLGEPGWERVAETVEGGMRLWAEVPPQASSQCAGPDVVGQADALTRPWRSVGLLCRRAGATSSCWPATRRPRLRPTTRARRSRVPCGARGS